MEEQESQELYRIHAAIASAVAAIRRGNVDDDQGPFGWLFTSSVRTARLCIAELAAANAQMLHALSGPYPRLTRSDGTEIDRLEPAEQAATRIMLAIAYRHPEDTDEFLDIVHDAGALPELRLVLAYTVRWTLELIEECERAELAVPEWVRPVAQRGCAGPE